MPPLPDVNHVAAIKLGQSLNEDSTMMNKFFIGWGSGTLTGADATAWAGAVRSAWVSHMAPALSDQLFLLETTVTDLTSATGAVGIFDGTDAGTSTNAAAPAGVTMRLGFKVARRYRGGHPGVYLSGLADVGRADAQTWNSGTVSGTLSAWEAFIGAVITAAPSDLSGVFHANVSYYEGFTNVTGVTGRERAKPTLRVTPVVDPIVGIHADVHIASQRRRYQLD